MSTWIVQKYSCITASTHTHIQIPGQNKPKSITGIDKYTYTTSTITTHSFRRTASSSIAWPERTIRKTLRCLAFSACASILWGCAEIRASNSRILRFSCFITNTHEKSVSGTDNYIKPDTKGKFSGKPRARAIRLLENNVPRDIRSVALEAVGIARCIHLIIVEKKSA